MLNPEGRLPGRYQIRHRLGRGGMAEVYLAYDQQEQREIALKLVDTIDSDHLARFRCEIAALERLRHPHILPILEHGEIDIWSYFVMPYVEEGTLRDRLQQAESANEDEEGTLSLAEAGAILEQVAAALDYAHSQGFVHRDIKPSNILLSQSSPDGAPHVYLADFGLTKEAQSDLSLTPTGCLIGTPEYMAPELADEEAGPSSDIYALGIVLYEMLTGQVPFSAPTPLAIYWKHLREKPQPPRKLNPAIPRSVERVILRALEKEPYRRYQTASELAQAYEQACLAAADENPASMLAVGTWAADALKRLPATASAFKRATVESLPLDVPGIGARLASSSSRRLRRGLATLALAGLLTGVGFSLAFTLEHPDILPRVASNNVQALAPAAAVQATATQQSGAKSRTVSSPVTTRATTPKTTPAPRNHPHKQHGHNKNNNDHGHDNDEGDD